VPGYRLHAVLASIPNALQSKVTSPKSERTHFF